MSCTKTGGFDNALCVNTQYSASYNVLRFFLIHNYIENHLRQCMAVYNLTGIEGLSSKWVPTLHYIYTTRI